MYSYDDRLRAVQLYIKLGKRAGLVHQTSASFGPEPVAVAADRDDVAVVQQPVEQSPVDAQKIHVAAARAPHAFPVRER